MRWISCSVRPDDASMRIFCSLPVPLSLAETFRMPLASMSNVTSICGTPRGAAGMPSRWKRPIDLLSRASGRSPWHTLISTEGWLSAAVEKTSLLRVGIVVLASMSFVITPPSVSIPSDSGVTSSSSTSFTSPVSTPPWIAAPMATTSSGFTLLLGALPKNSSTIFWIAGIRVEPPTRITSSICEACNPASCSACLQGSMVLRIRWSHNCSNLARVSVMTRCCGMPFTGMM